MSPQPDVIKPHDDPFGLLQQNWPSESESSYRAAEVSADEAATAAAIQAQSALDADSKMTDEKGKLADSIRDGYSSAATKLQDKGRELTSVSGWLADAAGVIGGAKKHMALLVRTGTSEIRDALNSELAGTPVTPSSTALTDKYRNDITAVASKLNTDLDNIGHSLAGDPGASRTPTYVRAAESPKTPTVEQAAVHHSITGEGPHVEPHQLPEMPRATSPSPTESPSGASTPSAPLAPHVVNPTLANLVGGGEQSSPSASSTKSPSTATGTSAGQQAHQADQAPEQQQTPKSPVLPRIPSVALPDLPAAAQTIATAVTSATAHQLPSQTPSTPGSSQAPVSTGFTPGTSGTAPVPSAPPVGLSPVGGLTPSPVVQGSPASQGTPATSSPAAPAPSPAQSPPPAAPRGPVADIGWLQRTYGFSPSLDLAKSETAAMPALFITDLPEPEATLHRALATLRQAFDASGWSQPLAVARIKRGFETKLVYVTADAVSIHPHGVLLPNGVIPLDEMRSRPVTPELLGSLMVTDKLTSLIPRGWTVEHLLSTVPGEENSQTVEQYQALVEGGELLPCKVSRGRDDMTDDEALRVFARAALGSGGCGELDVESARIRAARWIGVQPAGYLDTLARYYLSDAAESMSRGNWGEAVYSSEKYLSVQQSEKQAA